MCVRYTFFKIGAALESIARALGEPFDSPDWADPRYNVTLADTQPVIAAEKGRSRLVPMRWGFAMPGAPGRLVANAKAETAQRLTLFRSAARLRRCLVPADGFYEWTLQDGLKRPHYFTLRGERSFAFAGLWDPPDADRPSSYCILTTAPNALVSQVHDRMPVILEGTSLKRWVGDTLLSPEEFGSLTRPFPAEEMQSRPVSRFVNNSRHEGPECIAPAAPPEPELDLG